MKLLLVKAMQNAMYIFQIAIAQLSPEWYLAEGDRRVFFGGGGEMRAVPMIYNSFVGNLSMPQSIVHWCYNTPY